jgi:hypothetical protein
MLIAATMPSKIRPHNLMVMRSYDIKTIEVYDIY